jgi:hypothetical protein
MSDRFVVVATFALAPEAQLAVNLLESAGIEAMLEGDNVGGAFPGMSAWGDPLQVLVRAEDAQRATRLIAEAQAQVHLPGDWEDRAETTAVCSLCGGPVPEGAAECPACRTPRDAIRQQPADLTWGVRRPAGTPSTGEGIQGAGAVTALAQQKPPAGENDPPAPPPVDEAEAFARWLPLWLFLVVLVVVLAFALLR